ncbi:MAG: hypothetical protein K2K28_02745, partial [Clostridia bacterium]|nr:hypothetical protein [Clostridia bacterium]
MKKFLAVIASVVLAMSMLAFTGCKDKDSNPYVIEGNYKEATAEQVKTEFAKVDLSSAFGDVTANDYKLGFELSENLNVSMDTKMSMSGYTMDVNYSIGTDANYKLLFTDFENLAFSGSGYANLNGKMTVSLDKESQSESMSVKTNLYNDSEYVYVDMY